MTDDAEMLALLKRTHEWIDSLQAAGLTEGAIVSAILGALVERLLRVGGVEAAAQYLEDHGELVRKQGAGLLAELGRH